MDSKEFLNILKVSKRLLNSFNVLYYFIIKYIFECTICNLYYNYNIYYNYNVIYI